MQEMNFGRTDHESLNAANNQRQGQVPARSNRLFLCTTRWSPNSVCLTPTAVIDLVQAPRYRSTAVSQG